MRAEDLIYDWNVGAFQGVAVGVVDETLRDGLQGGVPRLPSVEERIRLLTRASDLGIAEATIGFPAQRESASLVRSILDGALERDVNMRFGLLGRMLEPDILAIQRVREETGASVSAWLFLGASPIRRYAEKWDIERLEGMAHKALGLAARLALPVNFGIEDSVRAEPAFVERLIRLAAEHTVETVTICDTVGHLTPYGADRAMRHFRSFVDSNGFKIRLDFHNHQDRGLGLANALAAARAGAERLHGAILGIGERSGNCPLDLLLVNLKIQNLWTGDLSGLARYCAELAEYCDFAIPDNYPVFGANAFRTQAGVHAAAIYKSDLEGETEVAGLVYAGVDPRMVGLDYDIRVGPDSGRSNVRFVLQRQGIEADDAIVDLILEKARTERRMLPNSEVGAMARAAAAPEASPRAELSREAPASS